MIGMTVRTARSCLTSLALLLLAFAAGALAPLQQSWASPGLTPAEERGRQIYFDGTSPSGAPIIAYFGKDYLEVPGESATCTSCHGFDGLGRTESGVIPSNVTWQHLMKSYGHVHPDGQVHGAFNEESLKSYMRDGLYPGGVLGDPAMPVYEISEQDLDDLIAYMKRLGIHPDPGVSATTVRVGTIIPAEGATAALGEALTATVRASFADVKERGGVYGRNPELVVATIASGQDLKSVFRRLVEEQQVFALLNTLTPGQERELETLAEEFHVPLIAPFAPVHTDDQLLHRYRFHLHGGVREQSLGLVSFAIKKRGAGDFRIAIVYPAREEIEEVAVSIDDACRAGGGQRVVRISHAPGLFDAAATVSRLQAEQVEVVFFLGGEGESDSFFREAEARAYIPSFFMPGFLLGKGITQVPAAFSGKVWLAFPSLPEDRKEWGLAEFNAVMGRQRVVVGNPTVQLTAFTGAKLFLEGLRRAGRDLSRERFVETLEKVFEYDTGLAQTITYTRNHRIGTLGTHVVVVDPLQAGTEKFIIPQGWIDLE
ncbi:ABC transporter substrate-binding protein [Geobacter sulfurreducens]|nr:ABC transporter substrate-binding protein [Geobacter sulfurreducens]